MSNITNHVTNALDSVQINCGSSSSTSPTVISDHKCKCDELRSEMCTLNSIINLLRITKVNFLVSFLGLDDDQSSSSNISNNKSQVHSSSVTESSATSNAAAAISGAQNSTNS